MRVVNGALHILHEYPRVHVKGSCTKRVRPKEKWECPPSGRLKLNLDGAFKSNGVGGAGVVFRDDKGEVQSCWSKKLMYLQSPLQAEALACRMGLAMAVQVGWTELLVESDSSVLVSALYQSGNASSEVSRIVEDCKIFMQQFDYITIRHIYREANNVAHRLAHFASLDNIVEQNVGEPSCFLVDVLYEDQCNSSNVNRGRGFMSPSDRHVGININNGQQTEPPM
ncbi:hypothetical protein ACLB2K_045669 [Fragaria x ananassa]